MLHLPQLMDTQFYTALWQNVNVEGIYHNKSNNKLQVQPFQFLLILCKIPVITLILFSTCNVS